MVNRPRLLINLSNGETRSSGDASLMLDPQPEPLDSTVIGRKRQVLGAKFDRMVVWEAKTGQE
jgi:hypothetical protein